LIDFAGIKFRGWQKFDWLFSRNSNWQLKVFYTF